MRLDVDWYRGSNCEHVFSICTYNHGQVYNVRSCDITHSQLPVGPNLFLIYINYCGKNKLLILLHAKLNEKQVVIMSSVQ